mmetsp:Transcript_42003/g.122922  ORF Transcript_42003/g.122922 Transcript_42003/m.122922 type:complete len:180 (-) Transcript_42003:1340-1879(-)
MQDQECILGPLVLRPRCSTRSQTQASTEVSSSSLATTFSGFIWFMFATPWRGVSLSGGEPSAEAWQAYRAQSRYRGAQWEEHGHLRSSRRSPWPRDCCTFSPKIHTVGPGKAELLEARCEQMLTPVDPGKAELLRMCANSATACESTASVHDSELLRHIPELLCDPHVRCVNIDGYLLL